MKKGEIKEKLIEILVNLLPNPGIDMDMFERVDLIDDPGMDSITVTLCDRILMLEDGISLSWEHITNCLSKMVDMRTCLIFRRVNTFNCKEI